eukprot:6570157-Alexandrium_andersonii.AAC.1
MMVATWQPLGGNRAPVRPGRPLDKLLGGRSTSIGPPGHFILRGGRLLCDSDSDNACIGVRREVALHGQLQQTCSALGREAAQTAFGSRSFSPAAHQPVGKKVPARGAPRCLSGEATDPPDPPARSASPGVATAPPDPPKKCLRRTKNASGATEALFGG